MITEVEHFRKMNLYKKAIRFTHLVLEWTDINREEIDLREYNRIRGTAMEIPTYIAKACTETNVKNKYKKLNRGKEALQKLMPMLRKFGMVDTEKRIVPLCLDLLRLFNGCFGMLNRRKNAS